MPRGLNDVKAEIKAAMRSGDIATAKGLLGEYKARDASRLRSLANAKEQYNATDGMSGLDKARVGLASSMVNIGRRAGQLLTPKSLEVARGVSDADIEEQTDTDKDLLNTKAGMLGRFVGDVGLTAPVGGGAGSALRAAGIAAKVAKTGKLAGLLAEGATAGELSSGDAQGGAAANAVLGGAGAALKRLAKGRNMTAEARRLVDQGFDLTPGQLNRKGVINQMEEGAERVPYIGASIQNARNSVQPALVLNSLSKVTGKKFPVGHPLDDAVEQTYAKLGRGYNRFRKIKTPATGSANLQADIGAAVALADVSDDAAKWSDKFLKNRMSRLANKAGNGEDIAVGDLIKMRSSIRDKARLFSKSTDLGALERVEVLEAAEAAVTKQINSSLTGSAGRRLKDLDRRYATFKPIEDAQFRASAQGDGATPAQMMNAFRRGMSPGRFNSLKGDMLAQKQTLRDVANVDKKMVRQTGISWLFPLLGGVTSPIVAAGTATQTGRRAFQGNLGIQKFAQRAAKNPNIREILEVLRRVRPGYAGASQTADTIIESNEDNDNGR